MTDSMKTQMLLLCHGIYKGDRKYRAYLNRAAAFAAKKGASRIIICGGRTVPGNKISEAESAARYIRPRIKKAEIVTENASITTAQNILFARRHIDPKSRVYIYSDNIRYNKAFWFALYYWFGMKRPTAQRYFTELFSGYFSKGRGIEWIAKTVEMKGYTYKNVTIVPDPIFHADRLCAVHQQISTVLEINGIYDSRINSQTLSTVRKKFGLKSRVRS